MRATQEVVSCSNGTHASRQFLSFLLRWRQPQPRNRRNREENREGHRPRARPLPPLQLARLPRLTRRLRLTPRPLRARRRTSPRHTCPRSAQPHKRPAPRRGSWLGPPAGRRPRPWHDTRRRREPLRLRRSNSRKLPAAAAGVERDSPNRPSLVRATMRRAHPRRRAPRRRWALRRRALRQQRSPLASDAMGPRSKM
jgi:hypothetical protein